MHKQLTQEVVLHFLYVDFSCIATMHLNHLSFVMFLILHFLYINNSEDNFQSVLHNIVAQARRSSPEE